MRLTATDPFIASRHAHALGGRQMLREFMRSICGGMAAARLDAAAIDTAIDATIDATIDTTIDTAIEASIKALIDLKDIDLSRKGRAIEQVSLIVSPWSTCLSERLHKAALLPDADMMSAVESAVEDFVDGKPVGSWRARLQDWIDESCACSPTFPACGESQRTPLWLGTVGGVKRPRADDDSESDDAASHAVKKQRANVVLALDEVLEEGEVVLERVKRA